MTRRSKNVEAMVEASRRILGVKDTATGIEIFAAFGELMRKCERSALRRKLSLTRAFDLLATVGRCAPLPLTDEANGEHYPLTGAPINPRHVLGVAPEASRAQVEAAFYRLVAQAPKGDAFSQCATRLRAARDALLEDDDGL